MRRDGTVDALPFILGGRLRRLAAGHGTGYTGLNPEVAGSAIASLPPKAQTRKAQTAPTCRTLTTAAAGTLVRPSVFPSGLGRFPRLFLSLLGLFLRLFPLLLLRLALALLLGSE
jgi:hypothetical protein